MRLCRLHLFDNTNQIKKFDNQPARSPRPNYKELRVIGSRGKASIYCRFSPDDDNASSMHLFDGSTYISHDRLLFFGYF